MENQSRGGDNTTRPFPGASQPPGVKHKWQSNEIRDWKSVRPKIGKQRSPDSYSPMPNQQRNRRPHHEVQQAIRSDSKIFELETKTKQMQAYITQLQIDLAASRENEMKQSSHIKKLIKMTMELSTIEFKLKQERKNTEIISEDFHRKMEVLHINDSNRLMLTQSDSLWASMKEMLGPLHDTYNYTPRGLQLKSVATMPIFLIYTSEQACVLEAGKHFRAMGVELFVGVFSGNHGKISGAQLQGSLRNLTPAVLKMIDVLEQKRRLQDKSGMKQYPPHFQITLLVDSRRLDALSLAQRNTYVHRNQHSKRLENCDALKIIGPKIQVARIICEVLGAPGPMQPPMSQQLSRPQPPPSRPRNPMVRPPHIRGAGRPPSREPPPAFSRRAPPPPVAPPPKEAEWCEITEKLF